MGALTTVCIVLFVAMVAFMLGMVCTTLMISSSRADDKDWFDADIKWKER